MKVAICTPMFEPVMGGAEKYVYDYGRYLGSRGNDVDILTLNLSYWTRADFPGEEVLDGMKVHRFDVAPFNSLAIRLFMLNLPLESPAKYIDKERPDLIHLTNMIDFTFPYFLRSYKLPKILSCVTLYEAWESFQRRRLLLSRLIKGVDCVHVFTKIDRDLLVKRANVDEDRVKVIPIGVDSAQYRASGERGGNVILFVGRIHPTKGIGVLIDACSRLKADGEVWIAGPIGDERYFNSLVSLAKRGSNTMKFNFFGKVSRETLFKLYSEADVFVLPSITESFGITILEAMASSLPIVASNVGGIPDVVKDGHNGFLAAPGDPISLSEKLEILLADDNLRRTMGQRNREAVLKNYEMAENHERIEQLYRDLM